MNIYTNRVTKAMLIGDTQRAILVPSTHQLSIQSQIKFGLNHLNSDSQSVFHRDQEATKIAEDILAQMDSPPKEPDPNASEHTGDIPPDPLEPAHN